MKPFREQILIGPTYLAFALNGFLFPTIGISLPLLGSVYGLSLDQVGFISVVVQLGFAVFCYLGGILSDIFGSRRILSFGCFTFGFSGILNSFANTFALNLVFFTGIGIGTGLIFVASNSLVIGLYPDKRSTYLNLHHTIFAFVSFSSPLINNALLGRGVAWYTAYFIIGTIAIFFGLFFFITIAFNKRLFIGPTTQDIVPDKNIGQKYIKIFSNRKFMSIMLSNFMAAGINFAVIYLFVVLLIQDKGMPESLARNAFAVYYICLASGRLICAHLVRRFSLIRLVIVLMASLMVLLISGWASSGMISLVLFALIGFACSGLVPGMLSLASRELSSDVQGAAVGTMSMIGGFGGMFVTYIAAFTIASFGFGWGYLTLILATTISIFLFVFFAKQR